MLGEILGRRAGEEETESRLRGLRLGVFLAAMVGVALVSGEVRVEGVEGAEGEVGVGTMVMSRLRNSEVSMLMGGMSSVGREVLARFMRDAGVTGALRGEAVMEGRGFEARGGGGAMRTSGSGSGETDSLDETS